MRAKPGFPANSALPSADTLAQVTDAIAWPLLLLRADTTLLHANEAARGLLRQGQPLHVSMQREVRPGSPHHRAAYEEAFEAALAKQPTRLLRWPAAAGGNAWCGLLRALPQTDGQDDGQQPVVLLLALCPDTGADSELLALLSLRPPLVPAAPPAPPTPEGE